MSNTQAAAVYKADGSVHFTTVEALHQFLALQAKPAVAIANDLVKNAEAEKAQSAELSIQERREALLKKAFTAPTITQPILLRRIRDGKEQFVQNKNRLLYASDVPGVDISDIEELTQYWNAASNSYGPARITKRGGNKIPAYLAQGAAEAIYGEVGKNWKRNQGHSAERIAARFQLKYFRR